MRYPNFYENHEEAVNRLYKTVVLYGEMPCDVIAITNHKSDGIFRVWLIPLGLEGEAKEVVNPFYKFVRNLEPYESEVGPGLDELLEKYPNSGVMRKHMNSPAFNRFRPFPLGMCNVGTQCYYVERQPLRPLMHQGLVKPALCETLITAGSRSDNPARILKSVDMYSPEFRDCIMGDHRSAEEVLEALLDPLIDNDAHAFHRDFALVRGPCEMIFLAYRTEVVGLLPNNDLSLVKLGKAFRHCREAVEDLEVFEQVK